jgi:hypothetical protein
MVEQPPTHSAGMTYKVHCGAFAVGSQVLQDCVKAVAADPGALGIVSADAAKKLPAGITVLVVP